jgi:hypothetical protein
LVDYETALVTDASGKRVLPPDLSKVKMFLSMELERSLRTTAHPGEVAAIQILLLRNPLSHASTVSLSVRVETMAANVRAKWLTVKGTIREGGLTISLPAG